MENDYPILEQRRPQSNFKNLLPLFRLPLKARRCAGDEVE